MEIHDFFFLLYILQSDILLNDVVYSLKTTQFLFDPVKIIPRRDRYFQSDIANDSAFCGNRLN